LDAILRNEILLSNHEDIALSRPGFRSQTRFINVEDVLKTCNYVSEIVDRGLGARPLFQVLLLLHKALLFYFKFLLVSYIHKTVLRRSSIVNLSVCWVISGFAFDAHSYFQVTHPTKREVYLHESMDGCWHEIQNQINEAVIARRGNSNLQLPPLLPPPSGVEMFGLTSSSIIEVKIYFGHIH